MGVAKKIVTGMVHSMKMRYHGLPKKSQEELSWQNLPPLSLYVHIPWCIQKCPYCDFNSHAATTKSIPTKAYIDALLADLVFALPLIWGRRFSSIFFGGGTPSLFSARDMDQLLTGIRTLVPILYGAEITLEANPGTLEADALQEYRRIGINRLSLGVQSFHNHLLKAIGRIHDAQQAKTRIEEAQRYFDNVNIDLMYGLPNQTTAEVKKELSLALSYQLSHISYYNLTIEPHTAFCSQPPQLPSEETQTKMEHMIQKTLQASQYDHYEISAYAQPGYRCLHNLNYWTYGDYLGIGAGACSKISLPTQVIRQMRVKHPRAYLSTVGQPSSLIENKVVCSYNRIFEFCMNALRLRRGFSWVLFESRTGLSRTTIVDTVALAESKRWVDVTQIGVTPTEQGLRFLNELILLFLPEKESTVATVL